MQYFFILGKNRTLSSAELISVFGPENLSFSDEVALLESETKMDPAKVISELGGTIKMGVIKDRTKTDNKKEVEGRIADMVLSKSEGSAGKFKFGISQYHQKEIVGSQKLGMEIKQALKEDGISSRMVTSREKTLSSVVVEQNNLTDKGVEIVLIEQKGEILIGKTQAVQPFKQLSRRDYGRPERDDHSGMLPPKLAQIMINLATGNKNKEQVLLDPFCGSGTILTEAMLKGFNNMIGTDTSSKAIADTEENIKWTKEQYPSNVESPDLYQQDATSISSVLPPESVDVVVTEPYLGPQREKVNPDKTVARLEDLYTKSLKELKKVLTKNAYVVTIFPILKWDKGESKMIHPSINGYEIIDITTENDTINKEDLTSRNTFVYGRKGQKVWREILILKKK